jgi:hypothetical protein
MMSCGVTLPLHTVCPRARNLIDGSSFTGRRAETVNIEEGSSTS